MGRRRANGEDNSKSSGGQDFSDVPFRDADPDSGEKPIDEIDDFRVSARDDKGGSLSTTFYSPPLLLRHVEIVVHSRRFPYLNMSDFIRHALVRHIRFCAAIRASIPRHLTPTLESMLEVVRDDEQRVQVEGVLQRIKERIDHYISRGEMGDAVALVHRLKNRLDGVQPSFWQREFTKAFYTRYGAYLDGKPVRRETQEGEKAAAESKS